MPLQIMELRPQDITEPSTWLFSWVPTPKCLLEFWTQPSFKHALWCSWQPQQISPQLSLQQSLETSGAGTEVTPWYQHCCNIAFQLHLSHLAQSCCSQPITERKDCRASANPSCGSHLLWLIYFQTATHHKNQSYSSCCCCYYKFRIQSTLHRASCRKPTLYVEKPVRH